jgi:hypothetical protein
MVPLANGRCKRHVQKNEDVAILHVMFWEKGIVIPY